MMSEHVSRLTRLWGKKAANGDPRWLPLVVHLADTAEVGKILWDTWLCEGAKRNIAENCHFCNASDEADKLRQARALFVFLCAAHDLGKATPAFQTKGVKVSRYGLESDADLMEREDACRTLDTLISDGLLSQGYTWNEYMSDRQQTPHALCSQVLLLKHSDSKFKNLKNIAAILGAHHGKPQDHVLKDMDESYPDNFHHGIRGKQVWQTAQRDLLLWAMSLSGVTKMDDYPCPNQCASVVLTGLLIMADWISSNEMLCPYLQFGTPVKPENSQTRAHNAWDRLGLTHKWAPLFEFDYSNSICDYYRQRFHFDSPNAIQQEIIEIARNQGNGGLIVIEAPMGYGKTEAALAAAEILAQKSNRTGIYFALPTQATSNGIFPRVKSWANTQNDGIHSIHLFHSKAEFNEEWSALSESIVDDEDRECSEKSPLIVNQWFAGRQKTMLADFVVGTIDQLLMGALKQKHVMLRHLGLANKVVIIDECHAYDAYMSNYLERILSWLGIYRVPVIVLSATLPVKKRKSLIDAYRHTRYFEEEEEASASPEWMTTRAYPLITSTGIGTTDPCCHSIPISPNKHRIIIQHISDDAMIDIISELSPHGGCIGIIVNTVSRAQLFARQFREFFGKESVLLFHSRFTSPDRASIENKLIRWLGKPSETTVRPDFKIVIGTQVLEQSLDIDFDMLFTDLAPMDLVLQRLGRLHRHDRMRPEGVRTPKCYVLGDSEETFERGTSVIYDNCLLMRTRTLLPDIIILPDDISQLVQDTYNFDLNPCQEIDDYKDALKVYNKRIENKRARAEPYCLANPSNSRISTILGLLKTPANSSASEEAVRDLENTIEVIVIQKCEDGYIHILDDNMTPIACEEIPSPDVAWEISKYRVSLPMNICGNTNEQRDLTIGSLEKASETVAMWQKARYLKGELFLILDEKGQNHDIAGFEIAYSKSDGLSVNKCPENYEEGA